MMKILFIRSNPVNPDSRVEKEITSLAKAGHKITLFAWDRASNHDIKKTKEQFGNYEVAVYRVGIESIYSAGFKKNLVPLMKFQKAIYLFIKKHKNEIDVIHACDFDTAFSSYLAKTQRCRFVYDVFDYYVDSFSVPGILKQIVERIDTHIMNKADAVIICTEERKKQLRYAHPKKLITIHNTPMKIDLINNLNYEKHDTIKIVYVGILSYGRNIIETCEFVSNNHRYELHIGGFGILEPEVQKYASSNDNIHYYGKLSYSETLQLEQKCDILIAFYDPKVPNHKYAAPNKFYEALMLGKMLIMAEGTGMSDVVRDNDIGIVVPFSCPKKGFVELTKRENEWGIMSLRAQELYERQYSWEKMERRLVDIYDEMRKY